MALVLKFAAENPTRGELIEPADEVGQTNGVIDCLERLFVTTTVARLNVPRAVKRGERNRG